ncbi:MAG: NnrS family protein, partial [Gallionellaceae bacterium]|nr:NnrS family protein [Gallionellaceae bacterium]
MLLWTLIRHRSSDSYRDNYFFFFILPAFLLAKNLMLSADYMTIGWSMAMGLFRMAFLVMLERTLATFMKGVFQVAIPRNAILDNAIKFLGLTLVLESFMPLMLSAWIALSLAILLLARFFLWKPQVAMRRLDIAVMYLGYLAIITQLLIHFAGWAFQPVWVGAVSMHVFTFGAMGIIIPAMLIRISKGHTGRRVIFDSLDKLALRIMLLGFVARIVAPQIYPAAYAEWIYLSAACWFACFTILAWRYIPFLAQPRVDGKEH